MTQGQSRRVQVEVKSVQESGTLPLMEECILSVGIGCVKVRPLRAPKAQESVHVSFCAFCRFVGMGGQPQELVRKLPPMMGSFSLSFDTLESDA